jgi:hypothetical protein
MDEGKRTFMIRKKKCSVFSVQSSDRKGGGKAAVDSLERPEGIRSCDFSGHRARNTKNFVPPFSKGETIW